MEQIISFAQNIRCATDFETMMQPYMGHLYKVAYRFTGGSVADGEDLIQELLIKLYTKRQQMQEIKQLRPWLVKVLYRIFIDQIRKQNRSPIHLAVKPKADEVDLVEIIPCSNKGPEESLSDQNIKLTLMQAVSNLNETQRSVCILHDMEGYTLVELEEILATPIGTLKSRLHRARANLRNSLQRHQSPKTTTRSQS